jgi:hypothetical protein
MHLFGRRYAKFAEASARNPFLNLVPSLQGVMLALVWCLHIVSRILTRFAWFPCTLASVAQKGRVPATHQTQYYGKLPAVAPGIHYRGTPKLQNRGL